MSSIQRIGALVEIVAAADGSVSDRLLALAYGASESSFIVLAHNGISARAVDRLLDRIVTRYGIRANGVIYADAANPHLVMSFARRAGVVVAESEALRDLFTCAGIAFCRVADAPHVLGSLRRSGRETRAVPPRRISGAQLA